MGDQLFDKLRGIGWQKALRVPGDNVRGIRTGDGTTATPWPVRAKAISVCGATLLSSTREQMCATWQAALSLKSSIQNDSFLWMGARRYGRSGARRLAWDDGPISLQRGAPL